jgi:hypothetical protein
MKTIQPEGLAAYMRSLPFLGRLEASHNQITAVEWMEFSFRYLVGSSGIADSGRIKLTFRFYSDWGDFQITDAAGAGYISAEIERRSPFPGETDSTVQFLKVGYDEKGHERPFQKTITIDVIDGFVKPGDLIALRLGDRRFGGPGTRVQTFAESDFTFRAYVDVAGTSRFSPIPPDCKIAIQAGPASRLEILTSPIARTGSEIPITLRTTDAWGNAANWPVPPRLEIQGSVFHPVGNPVQGGARFEWMPPSSGEFQLLAEAGPLQARAAVLVEDFAPVPRALFADLHIHSHDTVGTNSTLSNLRHARDIAGLDIFGYTANDFQITEESWNATIAECHAFDVPGRFVVFPGTEWCGNSAAGGDHNVVFLGDDIRFPLAPDGKSVRSFVWHENGGPGALEPLRYPYSELVEVHADNPEQFLFIPHVGGRRATLDWHQPELERLVEITSSWGYFPWLYQDAIARGYRVGASAAGDEHRGRPGAGAPGASIFGTRGGLTGVLSDSLDRASVARALRARRTWATTGTRDLALLRSGNAWQGDEIAASQTIAVNYRLLSQEEWEWIGLYDHSGLVAERDLHAEAGFTSNRFRLRFGGARIRDRYRWANWRLAITSEDADFSDVSLHGAQHPEQTIRQIDPRTLAIRTSSFGNSQSIEFSLPAMESSNLLRITGEITGPQARVFRSDIALEIPMKNLPIRHDLGGADLFAAIEPISSCRLPSAVEGFLTLPFQPHEAGHHPIYLTARTRSQDQVWTSPIFFLGPQ